MLDDDNLCNGTPTCDPSLDPPACVVDPVTIVTCAVDPEKPCVVFACVPLSGACASEVLGDGAACALPASKCAGPHACKAGVCAAANVGACDDGNTCTADVCDPLFGCSHATAPMDDLLCVTGSEPCVGGSTCTTGVCGDGETLDCDDGNACSHDACALGSGCTTTDFDGAPCDDNDACTMGDVCVQTDCVGAPVECDDGNGCTLESCTDGDCEVLPDDGAVCDDGDVCTEEECANAGCLAVAKDCDDGNPCTSDACAAAVGCEHTTVADATACGEDKVCLGGTCVVGFCGDGVVGAGESCDDGDKALCDGCEGCQERAFVGGKTAGWLEGPHVSLGKAGTVELWMKRPTVAGVLIAQDVGGAPADGSADWAIRVLADGRLQATLGWKGVAIQYQAVGAVAADGAWHHVAACFDAAAVRIFVDGHLAGAAPVAPGLTHLDGGSFVSVGGWGDGSGSAADFAIDEIRLSKEVRYTTDFTPPRRFEVDAKTVALWHLDEGNGTSATDATAAKAALKLHAGAGWHADACYGQVAEGAACGDGTKALWEACDDGDSDDGDGCNAVCEAEPNGTSCAAILADQPGAATGGYLIDPDGSGPIESFRAWCEMVSDGGGWTLAMKMNGASQLFNYAAALWTSPILYAPQWYGPGKAQVKLNSFVHLPVTQVRVVMEANGSSHSLVVGHKAASLQATFSAGKYVPTVAGRSAWKALIPGSSLQKHCNAEGFNVVAPPSGFLLPHARLGILGNNENDCITPDSFLGLGVADGVCNTAKLTAGNLACYGADAGDKSTPAWVWLWVR